MRRAVRWLFGDDWGIRSLDGVSRPDSPENRRDIARVIVPNLVGIIATALPAFVLIAMRSPPPDANVGLAFGLMFVTALVLTPLVALAARQGALWTLHFAAFAASALLVAGAFAVGSAFSPFTAALGYVGMSTCIFMVGARRVAFLHLAVLGAGYALVVVRQDGNTHPVSRWVLVMGIVATTGLVVSSLIERIRRSAEAEHEALAREHKALAVAEAAREELAELNCTLERRVTEQVDELALMGGLRRFLAEPVADAVLSGDYQLLEPHRRQIAVLFCDLRGFTSFVSGAEPEDVVEALDEYYRAVGAVLRGYEATVGTFAGDGIMAYLNDPVRCADPAGRAVAMANDLRAPMGVLIEHWARRGQRLGYGVGVAFGYATLGMIGFDGRHDYTPLGSVVNLAARLCTEAGDGEILVDERTFDALDGRFPVTQRTVSIKGLAQPMPAYLVGDPASEPPTEESERRAPIVRIGDGSRTRRP